MSGFIFRIIIFSTSATLAFAQGEKLVVSPTCDLHSDQVALVTCLNPFLEQWEMIRASVAAPGNIIIPVLHYTRDELTILCELYDNVSGFCFGQQVMSKCGNNSLVTAVRSLGQYVCEIRKPQVQARFDCIDAALDRQPQCREMIRGIPKPEMSGKKCSRIQKFFHCLHSEIYATCGVWGIAILVQAVDSLRCEVPVFQLTKDGHLRIVKNPSKRTQLAMQSAKALRELGGNVTAVGQLDKFSAIPEDPRIPEFLHNVRVDPVEAYYKAIDVGLVPHWRLNNAFLPQSLDGIPTETPPTFAPWISSGPFRGTVRTSRSCDKERDDKALAPCINPWFDTWLNTKEKHTPPAFLFFPVLFYSPEEILQLCDSYVELLDTCLTAKIMERCRKNQFIAFIRSHVGYICSVRGVNILSHFNCLADAVHSKPECRNMIQSLSVSDIRSDRCRTMPDFFHCMEPVIQRKCGTKGIAILVQAIEGFGCDIEDLKDNLLDGVDSSSKEEIENEIDMEIFATLPRNHPAVKDFRKVKIPKKIPVNKKRRQRITPAPTTSRVTRAPRTRPPRTRKPTTPRQRSIGPPSVGPPGPRHHSRQPVIKSVETVEKDPLFIMIDEDDQMKMKPFPMPTEFKMDLDSKSFDSEEFNSELDHFNRENTASSLENSQERSSENKLETQSFNRKGASLKSEKSLESLWKKEKSSKTDDSRTSELSEEEPSFEGSTFPEPEPEPTKVHKLQASEKNSAAEPEPRKNRKSSHTLSKSPPTDLTSSKAISWSKAMGEEDMETFAEATQPPKTTSTTSRATTTRRRTTRPPTTPSTSTKQTSTTAEPVTERFEAKASIKVTESEEEEERKEEEEEACTEEQEHLINECFTPLNMKWSDMIEINPTVHDIVFPLFRYGKWDIYELCNMRTVALKDCLTPKVTRNCKMDAILDIVNSLLGYACGDNKKEFFMGYECVHVVEKDSPECYNPITLPPTPGLTKEEKCVGMPTYVNCLTNNILKSCPNPEEGIQVLKNAVHNFGCTSIGKAEQQKRRKPSRRRRPNNRTRAPRTRATKASTTSKTSAQKKQTTNRTTQNPTTIKSSTVTSVAAPKEQSNSTVLTYHCTPDIQNYVTSCMLPLVGTWLQLRSDREVLNNYTFPLYMYSKRSILELCDHYANAFLRCDFPVFQACLHYEVARFSLNHLGYICRPEVIGNFFEHFDCITRAIAEKGQACNRYIEGTRDVTSHELKDRCQGIPEFYRCGRVHVHRACGKDALSVFKSSMQQMGCRVTPSVNRRTKT